jgi:hypothetical protein
MVGLTLYKNAIFLSLIWNRAATDSKNTSISKAWERITPYVKTQIRKRSLEERNRLHKKLWIINKCWINSRESVPFSRRDVGGAEILCPPHSPRRPHVLAYLPRPGHGSKYKFKETVPWACSHAPSSCPRLPALCLPHARNVYNLKGQWTRTSFLPISSS